ncbi:hypothetical protein KIPB_001173 [Kipferlia bialata]|uniref:Uncharacterized protein n=1 Tax=Kipferlia bialata TaxID=797122 RepID=A0A9K3GFK4_9EUKA|nr:hypothetical protein KIPB_001173 [Kipferlia bialata]|eukprot:g1173.t1
MADARSRDSLHQFSSDVHFDTTLIETHVMGPPLEMVSIFLFTNMCYDTCNVSLRTFVAFLLTILPAYHTAPGLNPVQSALDTLHLTHHLVHAVRASHAGVCLMTPHQGLLVTLAALAGGMVAGA